MKNPTLMEVLNSLESAFSPDVRITHDSDYNLLGYEAVSVYGLEFIRDNASELMDAIGKSVDNINDMRRAWLYCIETIQKEG